jgi:3-oxoacyl-[acyl-carrier protein] reductase
VYGAAKAGLLYLSRVLALELAPEVRVVTVSPAGVVTPLLHDVAGPEVDLETGDWTPLGPLARPEDVAAAVSYLASDDARHLTGIDLVVDGGTITASA